MSILSGIKKVIPYFKNADGNYEQLSYKTSSQTVDFDDGKTAETKLGAIKGITTSTSVTETGYAADAKTVSEIKQSLKSVLDITYPNIDSDTYLSNDEKTICLNMPQLENTTIVSVSVINTSQAAYLPQFSVLSFTKGIDDSNIFITIKNRFKDDLTTSIQVAITYTKLI